MNLNQFKRVDIRTNHDDFFNTTSWTVSIGALDAYTWYAFYVAYQTRTMTGPPTSVHLVRTKEAGTLNSRLFFGKEYLYGKPLYRENVRNPILFRVI